MEFLQSRSRIGHKSIDSVMLLQPVRNKPIFHGVQRADQPDLLQAALPDCDSSSIRNMEDWDVCPSCNLSIDLMGCVGAEQDGLCAASTQPHRRLCEEGSNIVPLILCLKFVDSPLVQVVEEQRRVRIVTVRIVHGLIDI